MLLVDPFCKDINKAVSEGILLENWDKVALG